VNQDNEPTEIIADPNRVKVLPPSATIEYEEEVDSEGEDQESLLHEHLHAFSNSWIVRVLCLILFLLSLAGLAFSFVIFLGCAFYAFIRLLRNDPQWAVTLKWFASGLIYGLVGSFCLFVGIFSPGRAAYLASAYAAIAKR
jgi:hypothetical protein